VNGNFNLFTTGRTPGADALSARIVAHFQDHELSARHLAFHPGGGSLVSVGGDNRLVWRQLVQSGLRLLGHAGWRVLDFSADGRWLAYEPAHGHLGLLQTTASTVFHEWSRLTPPDEGACMLALNPDGTLLATSSARGIQLWDADARAQVAFFPLPAPATTVRIAFHPQGNRLLYSALGLGVMEVAFRLRDVASETDRVEFAPPRALTTATNLLLQHFTRDNRSLIVLEACDLIGDTFRVWLWPDADPERGHLLADAFPLERFELSHDERWAVSSHLTEHDVWVWEPETQRRVARLNIPHAAESRLSPDGSWLLVSTAERHQLWDTRTWQPGPQWRNSAERGNWASTFSADGCWAATTTAEGHVEIRSIPDAQVVLDLPPPQLLRFQDLAFSPDRQRLYLWQSTGRLLEWDLRELRRELARRGLDWRDE
jgi:WD40 repeat protein